MLTSCPLLLIFLYLSLNWNTKKLSWMFVSNLTFIHWSILLSNPYLSMEGGIWGSVQLVEGHPALRQQILVLSMRAAEELLVRQHSGSVPWVAKKGAKKRPGKMKDYLSIWHSIWFLKWSFEVIICICLCPCTRVIQACSGIQNLGCWSHTVVSMRQLWFAKSFFGFVNEQIPATRNYLKL